MVSRMRAPGITVLLLIVALVGAGCSHTKSGSHAQPGQATVEIQRPENNGSVNILPCTISLSDGQSCKLIGAEQMVFSVQSGALWAAASSPDAYASPDSGYPVAWHSRRFRFQLHAGETVRLSVEPRSRGSTYIGGWTIKRAANKRGAGKGGFAVLWRAGRAWPALPDRER